LLLDTVRNLCKSKNVTIAQLERSVKLGNGTIRHWNHTYPSADRLARVADYFGVSMDYLMGRAPGLHKNAHMERSD